MFHSFLACLRVTLVVIDATVLPGRALFQRIVFVCLWLGAWG